MDAGCVVLRVNKIYILNQKSEIQLPKGNKQSSEDEWRGDLHWATVTMKIIYFDI